MDGRFLLLMLSLFSTVGSLSASRVRAPGRVDTTAIATPFGILFQWADAPFSTQAFSSGQICQSLQGIIDGLVASCGYQRIIRAFRQANRYGYLNAFIFACHGFHSVRSNYSGQVPGLTNPQRAETSVQRETQPTPVTEGIRN